jgi:hypothetical protein
LRHTHRSHFLETDAFTTALWTVKTLATSIRKRDPRIASGAAGTGNAIAPRLHVGTRRTVHNGFAANLAACANTRQCRRPAIGARGLTRPQGRHREGAWAARGSGDRCSDRRECYGYSPGGESASTQVGIGRKPVCRQLQGQFDCLAQGRFLYRTFLICSRAMTKHFWPRRKRSKYKS